MKKINYPSTFWMRSGLVVLVLFSISGLTTLWGQCTNTSAYGTANAPTDPILVTITTCNFGGEYATINNAQAGASYQFTGSNNSFLTVHQGTPSGAVLGFGFSPITVTVTATGPVYLHVNTDASCGTDFTCRTTTVQCMSCGAPPPPPANDLCANAEAITIPSATPGTTVNATGPDAITCVTTNSAPGVWYSFSNYVGNGSNRVILNTCTGTTFDTNFPSSQEVAGH
ncbi:MAG: hypothetical protein IPJ40_22760 [Saprospirales bacterium]|nr:hypothetical protein [Saprospirales bacterium]